MATHTIACAPLAAIFGGLAWDNTDRPTSIDVWAWDGGFGGARRLVKTIPASAIGADGSFDLVLEDNDRIFGTVDKTAWYFSLVMHGAVSHWIDWFGDTIFGHGNTWPATFGYKYAVLANTSGDLTINGTLVNTVYPTDPLPGGKTVVLKALSMRSGTVQLVSAVTATDGTFSVTFHGIHDEAVWIWMDSVDVPEWILSSSNSSYAAGLAGPVPVTYEVFTPLGTNSVYFTCPALTKYGGGAWIYADNEREALPRAAQQPDLQPGQVVFGFKGLGDGPYLIEIWTQTDDHDWDAYWPHIDEANDPAAWDVGSATSFTLEPGVNDLGMFLIKDYPGLCTVESSDLMTKLHHVGLSTRATAELLAGSLSSVHDLVRAGLSPRQAKTWLRVLDLPAPFPSGDWVNNGTHWYLEFTPPPNTTWALKSVGLDNEVVYFDADLNRTDLNAPDYGLLNPGYDSSLTVGAETTGSLRVYSYGPFDAVTGVDLFTSTADFTHPASLADIFVSVPPASNPRLKAFLRGGFTRHQAKLLAKLMEV